jgi:hypothetical protein
VLDAFDGRTQLITRNLDRSTHGFTPAKDDSSKLSNRCRRGKPEGSTWLLMS